jgi:hypothetical protein
MRSGDREAIEIMAFLTDCRWVGGIPELASPSDLILAADSGGHMLITGDSGCGQESLAHIVHSLSKRRGGRLVQRDAVPGGWETQDALLRDATKATLLLYLDDNADAIDRAFVPRLFSSTYQLRMIVVARNMAVARAAFGPGYVGSMMHVGLRPLTQRRGAIHSLLDRWFGVIGSPLRVAHLTEENQYSLQHNEWRDNLMKLRETAERLDAILAAPGGSLNEARKKLGVPRNTFYSWFGSTLRLSFPLISDEAAYELRATSCACCGERRCSRRVPP